MIQNNEIIQRLEKHSTIEAIPTNVKRIVISCQGFERAVPCTYKDWKGEEKTADGLIFFNPKDNAMQVVKQADGCLIMYDGPGRQEKVSSYLKSHPWIVKTVNDIQQFISYLKENVVSDSGKADLWDTNTKFASHLKDAPVIY